MPIITFSNKTKGILVLIGGILMHLISGSIHVWSSLNVYLISYLMHFSPSLRMYHGFFLAPLGVFSISLSMSLGGFLERNYGPRFIVALGTFIIIFGNILMYISKNIILDYFALIISGIGVGCNYLIPMRLGMKYFPKNRGVVVGTVQIGLAITATFMNIFAEMIINPNNEKADILIDGQKYFNFDVAKCVKKYIFIFICCAFGLSLCCIFCFFPFEEEGNKIIKENIEEKLLTSENDTFNNNNNKNENLMNKKIDFDKINIPLKIAIKTSDFWKLFLCAFLSNVYPPIIANTYRTYAQSSKHNYSINHLKYLASLFSGFNSFLRLIYGILFDIYGFKKLLIPGNIIIVIISIFFYDSVKYKILFSILMVLTGAVMGIYYSIFPAYVSKKFGIKYSSEIYGIIFIGFGIANIIGPSIIFIYNQINDDFSFRYIYYIGGLLSFISLIISVFYIKEEKNILNINKI